MFLIKLPILRISLISIRISRVARLPDNRRNNPAIKRDRVGGSRCLMATSCSMSPLNSASVSMMCVMRQRLPS